MGGRDGVMGEGEVEESREEAQEKWVLSWVWASVVGLLPIIQRVEAPHDEHVIKYIQRLIESAKTGPTLSPGY